MFVYREEYYLKNKEPRPGTEEHFKWQSEMDAGARQGRGHHRQAAPRPDRHRATARSRPTSRASPISRRMPTSCRTDRRLTSCSATAPPDHWRSIDRLPRSDPTDDRASRLRSRSRAADALGEPIRRPSILAAIVANWRKLETTRRAGRMRRPWSRRDAYGCGLEPVVARAGESRLRDVFRRAPSTKRARARAIAPTPRSTCSTAFPPARRPAYAEVELRPRDRRASPNSPNGTRSARRPAGDGGAALHVDTGMNRLGLAIERGAACSPPRPSAITASRW